MKIVMPKPDFSEMNLGERISAKCNAMDRNDFCEGWNCNNCALFDTKNYKVWKAQQKKDTLIKWPISSKERFFVLPVAFVNAMSNKWKKRLLSVLNEYNKTSDLPENVKFRVSVTKNGKYVKMPEIFKRM